MSRLRKRRRSLIDDRDGDGVEARRRKKDRERWNDWGIGLLLQGDLKGAEYAFHEVTEAEPGYADGWLNVARALIQEGETDRAKPFLGTRSARSIPVSAAFTSSRRWFRKPTAITTEHCESLRTVDAKYPRDRVALNQIGRILFLKREYKQSGRSAASRRSQVDPEDVQAHYTLMLCYRGLNETARGRARREAVPAIQGRRGIAGDHGQAAACSAPKITTSARRFTITRV